MNTVDNVNIDSMTRNEIGTNACNRLRHEGVIPSVIYGHDFQTHSLKVDLGQLKGIIRNYGENAIIEVKVDGQGFPAMIKEVQRDPITNEIIHLDLQKIDISHKITTSIPILIAGKKSLDNDHILQQQLQKIEVECYPDQVPNNVTVDISKLAMSNSYKVGDVELGEDITILTNADEIIASITKAGSGRDEVESDEFDYGLEEEGTLSSSMSENKDKPVE